MLMESVCAADREREFAIRAAMSTAKQCKVTNCSFSFDGDFIYDLIHRDG